MLAFPNLLTTFLCVGSARACVRACVHAFSRTRPVRTPCTRPGNCEKPVMHKIACCARGRCHTGRLFGAQRPTPNSCSLLTSPAHNTNRKRERPTTTSGTVKVRPPPMACMFAPTAICNSSKHRGARTSRRAGRRHGPPPAAARGSPSRVDVAVGTRRHLFAFLGTARVVAFEGGREVCVPVRHEALGRVVVCTTQQCAQCKTAHPRPRTRAHQHPRAHTRRQAGTARV